MRYSYEEIYYHFGQYDAFVTVQFQLGSEEYNKYGIRLMGVFKYELEERKSLEEEIKKDDVPRTDKQIKFFPSDLEKLSDDQKSRLR